MCPVPGPPLKVWIALVPSAWVIGVLLFFLFEVIIMVALGDPFVSLVVAIARGWLGLILDFRYAQRTGIVLSGSPFSWAQS
jgi:hypothetical protein